MTALIGYKKKKNEWGVIKRMSHSSPEAADGKKL